ncbi:peptidyl-prolyl cis-trans isomerase C/foldase protein PrsA [Natranaerovirga hydrolytica]|uniref:Peptidyl-prolyl cis-trans isomerase C/foldase protein PrsA n=1 Tax=Natranaerovirga hydrolytica TaxID=680378 RepID=A0A4R1M6J3_9FIRM|nr:peptidylprolyl isomerase [Natranaerovirga hydrolytica]TCK87866.1 peptidyl-prolyl cis-trans isomerase C/foldase protein PrsA [Natranaerovirga hydrolytica]
MKRRICIVMLVVILIISGCSVQETKNEAEEVIISINEQEVFLEEVEIYLKEIEKEFEAIGGKDIWETNFDGKTASEVAKERVIENIVQIKIINDKAKELGMDIDQEESESINEYVQNYKKSNEGNINETLVEQIFYESFIVNKVFEELTKGFEPNLEQTQEYINNDETLEFLYYLTLGQVRAKHILIEGEEHYKKAVEIQERAKDGEDFVSLVLEYSEDQASLEDNGEYTFYRGEMMPEFEEAAFNLEPGEISEVIETSYGYHIIQTEEFIDATENIVEQYEAYKEVLEEESIYVQKNNAFYKQYEEWKRNYTIRVNEEIWEDITLGIIIDEE